VISLVVAAGPRLHRDALVSLLRQAEDINVVAQTGSVDDVVELVRRHDSELALLDIDESGAEALRAAECLREQCPTCRVVVLTSKARPGHLHRAIRSGVRGFATKDLPGERLAEVIRDVRDGRCRIDPDVAADAIMAGGNPLRSRELQVLRLAEDGRPMEQIARTLALSAGTVRNYMSSAMAKLDADNKVQAIRAARGMGWL